MSRKDDLSFGEKLDRVMFVCSILLIIVVALSGCATAPVTAERPLRDRIPPSLLQCAPAPTPGDLARQSDVASYVVDLGAAGEDCRRKVGGIKRIVEADW